MRYTRSPTDVDTYIGQRIRARRLAMGMTQKELADRLGITFQQVLKYEKGRDRVACSRLSQIAAALGASPASFFPRRTVAGASTNELAALVDRPDTMKVLRALKTLTGKRRAMVVAMAEWAATQPRFDSSSLPPSARVTR